MIEQFAKLPGIGPKSAQRLALYLLHSPEGRVKELGDAVLGLKDNVMFCNQCCNIAESDPCMICSSEERDHASLCVVEDILDVVALEKTKQFNGLYHVLHGALSPVDGIGPDQLKLAALFDRVEASRESGEPVKEIILATNPSLEGEATALYIQKQLFNADLRLTRIARGLPVGGDLDYADEVTLSRALQGRGDF